jgi:hypothetical protein
MPHPPPQRRLQRLHRLQQQQPPPQRRLQRLQQQQQQPPPQRQSPQYIWVVI